jgi:ATP-dependent RNA helicase DeaD
VRIARFKDQISDALAAGGLEEFQSLIEDYEREKNIPAIEIAAALAKLARGDVPLLLDKKNSGALQVERFGSDNRHASTDRLDRAGRNERSNRTFERADRPERQERRDATERPAFPKKERVDRAPEVGMQTFRLEVGHAHGVKPGNIVGAIANEAGLDSKYIGRIEIYDDYSTLDLPDSMPDDLLNHLKTVWVAGRQLHISREGEPATARKSASRKMLSPESEEAGMRADRVSRKDHSERHEETERPAAPKNERSRHGAVGMQAYRIEVGHVHGVKPANIVGAIANEAGLDPKYIGRIDIHDDYSVLDLPEGMPKEVFEQLKTVSVSGQQLRISHASGRSEEKSNFTGKKIALSVPKKGGDRRVSEKKSEGKARFKAKTGSSNRMADVAKPKPKPHRKGSKPS